MKILTASAVILLLTGLSCNSTTGDSSTGMQEMQGTADNSRNALDWAGTYRGTLPCADCEGIDTEIILSKEDRYVRNVLYLVEEQEVLTDSGTFTWDETGNKITLSGDEHSFQVGEGRLFYLDLDGNRITSELAEYYILKKE